MPVRLWRSLASQYRVHTMEFSSDDDARRLSAQFKIPLRRDPIVPFPSEYSEICFYNSPAFAALRKASRCAQVPLSPIKSWGRRFVLTVAALVAISDHDFAQVKQIVDWCIRARAMRSPHEALAARWQVNRPGFCGGSIV